ncbi:MAG: hypothetical protein RLZZ56_846 [Actinomycetota bacterium]|jgi:hypothetical protein
MSRNRTFAAAAIVALCLTLSGCVNPLDTLKFDSALAQLRELPVEGFEETGSRKPTCGIDYCEPNPAYTFTSTGTDDSWPVFCQKMIKWVVESGGDSWLAGDDFIALPIKGYEDAAQFSCVGRNTSFVGSKDGIRWWVVGGPDSYELSTVMSKGDYGSGVVDDRMLPHTWDEGIALLLDGTKLTMEILSAIETYRTENPSEDPTSVKTIEKALNGVDFEPKDHVITDENGKAHYIYIPADGVYMERCLNITPYDPEYFGAPNPKTGFLANSNDPTGPRPDQFGYVTSGPCQ